MRAHFRPDERVIAWGTVGAQPTLWDIFGLLIGFALPGPGWIVSWLMSDSEGARFVILTNQRLLAMPTKPLDLEEPGSLQAIREFPFDSLEVNCPDGETFIVREAAGAEAWSFVVSDQESRPAERLRDALARLCDLDQDPDDDASPDVI